MANIECTMYGRQRCGPTKHVMSTARELSYRTSRHRLVEIDVTLLGFCWVLQVPSNPGPMASALVNARVSMQPPPTGSLLDRKSRRAGPDPFCEQRPGL